MKKISLLLMILCLIFVNSWQVLASTEVEPIDINDLNVEITGSSKTTLDIFFTTESELENLEIWIYSNLNDGTGEFVYSDTKYNDEELVPVHEKMQVSGSNGEVYYQYTFKFNLNSGKIGTFELLLKYDLNDKRYSQSIYVTNGNANLDEDLFSTKNAILIGVFATIASAVGTLILIKYSEKNAQISDDEE